MTCNTYRTKPYMAVIAFLICFLTFPLYVEAKAAPSTLSTYIQTKCKTGCADAQLLQLAAHEVGKEFGINPLTLLAIASVESSFKPKAINKTSGRSVGLMQIQVFWHKSKFQTKNYFDVFDNLRVGAIVYKECVTKWRGSREKALWCYNGHTRVGMKTYVPKVLKEMNRISQVL